MKNFNLSLVAILAMSAFAVAGGDIAPVEEPMVEVVAPATESGFYIGGAYSAVNSEYDSAEDTYDGTYGETAEIDYDALMLQVGYLYNKYLAIEGRYWTSMGDGEWSYSESYDGETVFEESDDYGNHEFTAWGIYVKPMYPVTEAFDVYGLLGYGNVTLSDDEEGDFFDENGFQWGIGAAYSFTENLSVFVDYVRLADKDESGESGEPNNGPMGSWTKNTTVDTWNFGLTYKF